jgi:hypothetical protein
MLTLLTTTGARPAAFDLCERMMFRQDYEGPVTWIVVDDGAEPQPLSDCREGWRRIVLRPEPFWSPGDNTQARNLAAGLAAAETLAFETGEELRLVVIEDDDWYDPRWLSTVDAMLRRAELVGEPNARYYNAAMRRGNYLNNAFHASLRSSALRGRAIDALKRTLAEFSTYYDFKLWRDPAPTKHLFETALTVGMKGLPGRPGIAAGHREMAGYPDPDMTLLRQWIGDDAGLYARFMREDAMSHDRTRMYATGKLNKYENRMLVAGEPFECKNKDLRIVRAMNWGTDQPPAETGAPQQVVTAPASELPVTPADLISETPPVAEAGENDAAEETVSEAREETTHEAADADASESSSEEVNEIPASKPRKRRRASSKTDA